MHFLFLFHFPFLFFFCNVIINSASNYNREINLLINQSSKLNYRWKAHRLLLQLLIILLITATINTSRLILTRYGPRRAYSYSYSYSYYYCCRLAIRWATRPGQSGIHVCLLRLAVEVPVWCILNGCIMSTDAFHLFISLSIYPLHPTSPWLRIRFAM